MTNQFKNCPKHKKPLPCPHCAIAVPKAAPVSESLEVRTPQQIVDEVMQRVSNAHDKSEVALALEIGLAETRKRGRPTKYKTEEERKAADAARNRGNRKQESDEKLHEKLSDRTGTDFKTGSQDALIISNSGGYDANKMEEIAGELDPDASGLSNPDADVPEEWTTTDRKVVEVPVHPDSDTKETGETDDTFMRKADAALSRWAKAGGPKKKKSCIVGHQRKADQHKDSKIKVYCSCGKLLVNPGKTVKGIKRTEPEIIKAPVTPLAA